MLVEPLQRASRARQAYPRVQAAACWQTALQTPVNSSFLKWQALAYLSFSVNKLSVYNLLIPEIHFDHNRNVYDRRVLRTTRSKK